VTAAASAPRTAEPLRPPSVRRSPA
jgi:hypothetical protein